MSGRELCHSTSKPIGVEEDTLKSFMAFVITPHRPVFRMVVASQIVVPTIIRDVEEQNSAITLEIE